jgi:hypothetical protein
MQALGWRYVLFPGLFGALLLMGAAAVTDELARAHTRAHASHFRGTVHVLTHQCAHAPAAAVSPSLCAQKRRYVFELADVARALRLGGGGGGGSGDVVAAAAAAPKPAAA